MTTAPILTLALRLAGAALLAVAPAIAQEPAAVVTGVVVDRTNQTGIEGARVTLLGTGLATTTDSAGRFRLRGLPAGMRLLQIRAVGYAAGSWLLQLAEGQRLTDTFDLEPRAVEMAPVDIRGAPPDVGWRSEAAFEQRRQSGNGFFITREDILRRRAVNVADLMRTVPGVMSTCTSRGCVVQMVRSTSACRPEYFLDGFPATFSTGPNFPINVAAIRGVEVYRDPGEVPTEFQRPNLRCGVIAIWTIDPGETFDRRP
jgi:hypothetical protein